MHKSQKKLSPIYYVVGAIILLAVGFIVFHDIPMKQTHVEEVIE